MKAQNQTADAQGAEAKHANGEWKVTHSEARVLATDMNGNLGADCGREGNKHAEESAKRIVKAMNLLSALEKYITINKTMQWSSDKEMAHFGEFAKELLLKQSEQK